MSSMCFVENSKTILFLAPLQATSLARDCEWGKPIYQNDKLILARCDHTIISPYITDKLICRAAYDS